MEEETINCSVCGNQIRLDDLSMIVHMTSQRFERGEMVKQTHTSYILCEKHLNTKLGLERNNRPGPGQPGPLPP